MDYETFLKRAHREYGVNVFGLMVEGGFKRGFLVRPQDGTKPLRVPAPALRPEQYVPLETVARLCRSLNMKPHDFGYFIG